MNLQMWWPIGLLVLSNVFYAICSKSVPQNVHPMAALTVAYVVAAICSAGLYFLMSHGGNILKEYQNLNWSSFVLGFVIIGLEAGAIFMYRAGWPVNAGQLVQSSIVAIILIFVGHFLFHEVLTPSKLLGIFICMVGLFFINR